MDRSQTKGWPSQGGPLLIFVYILSLMAIMLFFIKLIQLSIMASMTRENDLTAYFDAGIRLAQGQDLYAADFDLQRNQLIYIYPPLLAFAFVFVKGYISTWWIWFSYSVLCWFMGLKIVLQELKLQLKSMIQTRVWWVVFISSLIVFLPVQVHLAWGQVQLLLLLIISLAWLELRRGHEHRAGLGLGFAIAIKIYPAFFLVPLIVARRWRVLTVALLTASLLFLLSFALIGDQQTVLYVQRMLPAINALSQGRPDTHSLSTTLLLLFGDTALIRAIGTAFRVVIGCITVLACIRWRISASGLLALGIPFFLLTTPLIWTHYFVLLYLPWLVAFAHSTQRERLVLGSAFFLVSTATAIFYVPDEWVVAVHGLPMLGVLLVFITLLRQARTQRLIV